MDDPGAVADLAEKTSAYSDPPISAERLLTLLQARRRVRVFRTSEVYRVGELVLPPGADAAAPGVAYLCINGGMAGLNPPSIWPVDGRGVGVSGSVSFRLFGGYDGSAYNMDSAARAVYLEKAAKVAERISLANGPDRLSLDQQYDHFMGLAKQAAPEWPL